MTVVVTSLIFGSNTVGRRYSCLWRGTFGVDTSPRGLWGTDTARARYDGPTNGILVYWCEKTLDTIF